MRRLPLRSTTFREESDRRARAEPARRRARSSPPPSLRLRLSMAERSITVDPEKLLQLAARPEASSAADESQSALEFSINPERVGTAAAPARVGPTKTRARIYDRDALFDCSTRASLFEPRRRFLRLRPHAERERGRPDRPSTNARGTASKTGCSGSRIFRSIEDIGPAATAASLSGSRPRSLNGSPKNPVVSAINARGETDRVRRRADPAVPRACQRRVATFDAGRRHRRPSLRQGTMGDRAQSSSSRPA